MDIDRWRNSIYYTIMDIVKAFNANDLHTEIIIKGTIDDPLFRASDVGVILEISNIRMSITDFDNSEKRAVSTTDGTGRLQDITFLTEKGLYKVLFRSRKPIAQKFQNWVCDVIKEIRVTGIYNMQKEIDKKQEELASLETTKEKEKSRAVEQVIISQFPQNTECVYFGTIANTNEKGEKLIKFGISNDLSLRVLDHRKKYMNFRLVCAFRVQNKTEIENLMKKHPKIQKHLRTIQVNDKCKTEIIAYDEVNLTIDKLQKYIKDIIDSRKLCIENFVKMENEIQMLYSQNEILKTNVEMMTGKYTKLLVEHDQLQETVKKQKAVIDKIHKEENDNTIFPPPEINEEEVKNEMATSAELTAMFNEFVSAECIVRSDVYESSVQLEGRFRLWRQSKPKKEIFHAFKSYMDTRFQPKRMPINKQNAHCYVGIKLREAEYKKKFAAVDAPPVETFLFQMCKFSDNGKILNSVLLREYKKWKQSVHRECATDEVELKELKGYLNACPYALKATVWTEHGVNEGYYGLSLMEDYIKQTEQVQKSNKNTTGKVVEKREIKTNELIGTWDSIADAAISENVCAAKMSRYIREKKQIGDYCYVTVIHTANSATTTVN